MIDYSRVKSLADQYGTPFYVFHQELFKSNVCAFKEAFLKRYPKVIVGYSFKTNYIPAIAGAAQQIGCFAEVVSGMEYEIALRLGYTGENIIFNGPIKKRDEIFRALEQGAVINLDSRIELEHVLAYRAAYPARQVKVGLRINIELNKARGMQVMHDGNRYGRFGLTPDHLEQVIPLLQENSVRICSLHGHTTSVDRAPKNYEIICRKMLQVAHDYSLNDIEQFNIGGGFFGAAAKGIDITDKPSYEDYAQVVLDCLLVDPWFQRIQPALVIEPGGSVVSNTFSIYTQVHQHKKVQDKHFVVVDSGVFEIKPSMHGVNLPQELLAPDLEERPQITAMVVGSTCMERDVIARRVAMPLAKPGDMLRIDGVGAYTLVFTPNTFINFVPPVLVVEEGQGRLIRRRQTLDDVMATYCLE